MLKGELGTFSLGEVFQSLAINNHTGTLKITSPTQPLKLIYFEKGEITLFSSGSTGVSRIGEMLTRLGRLTQEQLDEALAEQKETKEVLGAILIRKQVVTEEDLRYALTKKTKEELYDLFLWKEGSFEFHLDYFPEDQIDDIQKTTRISLDVNSVTMEGLRQLDEWNLIHANIKTFNEIFTTTRSKYGGTDPLALHLISKIDGATPVKKLLKSAPGGKFECARTLHELVEAGHLRPLTLEELRIFASQRVSERQYPQAAVYLQFAAELEPEDPEIHKDLGEALASYYQEENAASSYLRAMRLFYQRADYQKASQVGENALRRTVVPEEDLEKLVHALLSLGNLKKASVVAHQLVNALQKKGELRKAALVLESIAKLDPDNLNRKIEIATLFEKGGSSDEAMTRLEEVAKNLEKQKRLREVIKIVRLMLEFDPKRLDLKQRIAELQVLEERLEKRKRKRLTTAGIVVIAFFLVTLIPVLYELKSRESFYHAQRMEEIAHLSEDYSRAKAAYEQVIARYSFSTKSAEAKVALERISSLEAAKVRRADEEAQRRKQEQEAKLQAMKQSVTVALNEATAAVQDGDLKRAHEIYNQVKRDYEELAVTKKILLPVRLSTYPQGATIHLDGKEIGKTPLIYYYTPGTKIQLSFSRSSCETLQQTLELRDQWELHYPLRRIPLGEFVPASTIQQPMVVSGGLLMIISRDGGLYASDPEKKQMAWQRTVGRFGDRISNLTARGDEVYLGTVSAEVTAISASTGESRWVSRVGGPVLAAPGLSDDGNWVAVGTARGTVEILSNKNGTLAAKFTTENEITAKPLFVGQLLIVGSTDNALYGYSMERRGLEFMEEFDGDILLDPCAVEGGVVVSTADNKVHRVDLKTGAAVWIFELKGTDDESISALGAAGGSVHVGTSKGRLLLLDAKDGTQLWTNSLGRGAVTGFFAAQDKLYASLDSGGIVAVSRAQGKALWNYQSDNAIIAAPIVFRDLLCFGDIAGNLRYIEVME